MRRAWYVLPWVAVVVGASSHSLLSLPACRPARKPQAQLGLPPPKESTHCVALSRNETALSALKRFGLSDAWYQALAEYLPQVGASSHFGVGSEKCAPGESLVGFFRDTNLYRFEYRRRYDRTHVVLFDATRTRLASAYHWVRTEAKVYSGVIQSSLWGSMIRIGQKPDMIMRFADLFGWDIDFFTETQAGDSFKLLVEQLYCDDRPIGSPRLQVGEYRGRVGEYHGFFYEDPSGRKDYYTKNGESVRKGFLRSPLQYSRISSRFSSGRYHPILRYVRPHQGVDYSARTGTPVSAIGDGAVTQCGWSGGYGKLVQISHGNGYQSRYGHLSRFGKIRSGSRVTQGQVIGYVGSTGMSTGPHLHFELRVNGVARNPQKIIPPRAEPVAKAYLADFRARADSLMTLLNAAQPTAEDKTAPRDSSEAVDSAALDPDK